MYATDVDTGRVIRCKVYIDNLARIQIFHSSVKLDLDGLATLRVRAFDSQGMSHCVYDLKIEASFIQIHILKIEACFVHIHIELF